MSKFDTQGELFFFSLISFPVSNQRLCEWMVCKSHNQCGIRWMVKMSLAT